MPAVASAAESTPAIFTEDRCFDGVRLPGRPLPIPVWSGWGGWGTIGPLPSQCTVVSPRGTINVSSSGELSAALNAARPGDHIVLASGNYNFPEIKKGGTADAPVVIRAETPATEGGNSEIMGGVSINASNIVLDGFHFQDASFNAVGVFESANVQICRNAIRNSRNQDYGVRIHESTGVVVSGNHFEGSFNHGISMKNRVGGVSITNNRFVDCGTMCLDIGQTQDGHLGITDNTSKVAIIEGNTFEGRGGNGAKFKNIEMVRFANNIFTGDWRAPIETNFGSMGGDHFEPGQRIGQYGPAFPTLIEMSCNRFGDAGTLILNGRGSLNDTIRINNNSGSVDCRVGPFEAVGGEILRYLDTGAVYRGPPRIIEAGNSFSCSGGSTVPSPVCAAPTIPVPRSWTLAFDDPGSGGWSGKYDLHGPPCAQASNVGGIRLRSCASEDDSLILWTRQRFDGDMKVEYDYRILSNLSPTQEIASALLIGTGDGATGLPADFAAWTVPFDQGRYQNTNTLWMNYAYQNPASGDPLRIRLRRNPGYNNLGDAPPEFPFNVGTTYHIVVEKVGSNFTVSVTGPSGTRSHTWSNSSIGGITGGYVGFRNMHFRETLISNVRIYTR